MSALSHAEACRMKKVLFAVCAMTLFSSQAAWADARQDLQQRLNKVNSFQANFSQTVTSNEGSLIQKGEGSLKVQRPDLFNWHMTAPDESTLISDGKTLWFYNPFVEQVTATWLESATTNTPFMLIARNDSKEWQNYDVKQSGDRFELTPKVENNLKHFTITVLPNGQIQQFAAIEQDGQVSNYQLTAQTAAPIDASAFRFTPPAGVTVDDQRQ